MFLRPELPALRRAKLRRISESFSRKRTGCQSAWTVSADLSMIDLTTIILSFFGEPSSFARNVNGKRPETVVPPRPNQE
jgi:hypothetical protein